MKEPEEILRELQESDQHSDYQPYSLFGGDPRGHEPKRPGETWLSKIFDGLTTAFKSCMKALIWAAILAVLVPLLYYLVNLANESMKRFF